MYGLLFFVAGVVAGVVGRWVCEQTGEEMLHQQEREAVFKVVMENQKREGV